MLLRSRDITWKPYGCIKTMIGLFNANAFFCFNKKYGSGELLRKNLIMWSGKKNVLIENQLLPRIIIENVRETFILLISVGNNRLNKAECKMHHRYGLGARGRNAAISCYGTHTLRCKLLRTEVGGGGMWVIYKDIIDSFHAILLQCFFRTAFFTARVRFTRSLAFLNWLIRYWLVRWHLNK